MSNDKPEVMWNTKPPTPLTEDQKKAFAWIIKIFKKRPEDLTDHERQAQKIYKNLLIF